MTQNHTAQRILERLSELKHGPEEEGTLTPYEEFVVDDKTYYSLRIREEFFSNSQST